METTTVTRKTRVDETQPTHETKITINWDSPEHERAFATRGVVIAAQAMMRASGDIPSELVVSVAELAKRERGGFAMKATPANAQRMMGKLDDAAYALALTGLGMTPAEVKRLVAVRAKQTSAPATK